MLRRAKGQKRHNLTINLEIKNIKREIKARH